MLTEKQKRNLSRIIPFAMVWLFFGIVYALLEKGIMGDLKEYPATGIQYEFKKSLYLTIIGSFLSGLTVGTIEVLFINKLFRKRSFALKLIGKTFIYALLIFIFIIGFSFIISSSILELPVYNARVLQYVEYDLRDSSFWLTTIYIGAIALVSIFILEISDNLGAGVLKNFIFGKYHKPVEESRVFMFLDMKSSTTIAEELGHVKYFKLLKKYYAVMNDAIINSGGEVYQYVGDEIVISWPYKNAIKNANCIRCFFNIEQAFKKNETFFKKQFGILPGFKAALHYGQVTTGEIGTVKKEILFTGDVLNTTARIQGLCNEYDAKLLVSKLLLDLLTLPSYLGTENMGALTLKGKQDKVTVFKVDYKNVKP